MQAFIFPKLISIPYDSGFTPKEYNISPILGAFCAWMRKRKWKHPENFPLDRWMLDFAIQSLDEIKIKKSVVCDVFNVAVLSHQLRNHPQGKSERFWLKYTSPIQLDLVNNYYS